MFRPILAVVAALMASVPATAATDPGTDNRQRAALVEWTVANCDADSLPAMYVAMGAMIANGSTPEQMAEARDWIRAKISETYADTPAACAAIVASFKQP